MPIFPLDTPAVRNKGFVRLCRSRARDGVSDSEHWSPSCNTLMISASVSCYCVGLRASFPLYCDLPEEAVRLDRGWQVIREGGKAQRGIGSARRHYLVYFIGKLHVHFHITETRVRVGSSRENNECRGAHLWSQLTTRYDNLTGQSSFF